MTVRRIAIWPGAGRATSTRCSDTEQMFVRDGSVCDQAVAMMLVWRSPSLMWRTEDEAAREGLRDPWATAQGPIGTR